MKPSSKKLQGNKSFSKDIYYQTEVIIEPGLIETFVPQTLFDEASLHSQHFVITDTNVEIPHADKIISRFKESGISVEKIVIPAGEASKSFDQYERIANEVLTKKIDKHSYLISVGGGVVNNIAGFLASTLYRGIGLIHFPTSMMAQVDAAIDFKQAINASHGKNLIGSYYPATYILIDPNALKTLSFRHIANGMSEAIKHALIQEKTLYDFLIAGDSSLKDISFLTDAVETSIALKIELMNGDENDDRYEMSLQYGHCIGHAIEHVSNYDLLHGEAIAIGMCISAEIAHILGVCTEDVVAKHYSIFEQYTLPTVIPNNISNEEVLATIFYDKHFVKKPFMALPQDIGVIYEKDNTTAIEIDQKIIQEAMKRNRQKAHASD